MTKRKAGPKDRERGRIEVLPSGSLRVVVYAGVDPLTGLRNYRHETIPKDTPDLWDEAEKTKTQILNEIDEQRSPRTKANVNTLVVDGPTVMDFPLQFFRVLRHDASLLCKP